MFLRLRPVRCAHRTNLFGRTESVFCGRIRLILTLLLCLVSDLAHAAVWDVRLLPGEDAFVFTLYSPPGDLPTLRALTPYLEEKGLANGFDPGPAASAIAAESLAFLANAGWPCISYPPYGDFQVENGLAVLSDADESAIKVFDTAGVFHGIQLGEWGYFFHNLSMSRAYFRSIYGDQFGSHAQLIRPARLRGYERMPTSRKECHDVLRTYWNTRNRAMRGRNISVTGHSHYESYAAAWGARLIGLEVGENIGYAQSKMAFARGASRQWDVPWSVQVSPWFHGACTSRGDLRMENCDARGLDAGHSQSFYARMWLHAWFAGAAMVTPENSFNIFFEQDSEPWKLSPHGNLAVELFEFMRTHDRGVAQTPVAIVLDEFAGYNGYMRQPWGVLPNTIGDWELYDLFQQQVFPGSDIIHSPRDDENPEAGYLRPTPFGEMFDVVLSTASTEVLSAYPVLLLVGDHAFAPSFVDQLADAMRRGSRVLLHPRHVATLRALDAKIQDSENAELLEDWINPVTGRTAAIAYDRLRALRDTLIPVEIEGGPVQFQWNKNKAGWVLELVNNAGVIKKPSEPATVNPDEEITLRVRAKLPVLAAREWVTGEIFENPSEITLKIPSGASRFLAYTGTLD